MVGVFVGDENAVHASRAGAPERLESAQHLFFAEAGVNQESGALGFEQCGIARTSRRQNGYAKRDRVPHEKEMIAERKGGVKGKNRGREAVKHGGREKTKIRGRAMAQVALGALSRRPSPNAW